MVSRVRKFVGITVDDKIITKIREEAVKQHRSLSAQVVYILDQWIKANTKTSTSIRRDS